MKCDVRQQAMDGLCVVVVLSGSSEWEQTLSIGVDYGLCSQALL